jgi:hypothetical protein
VSYLYEEAPPLITAFISASSKRRILGFQNLFGASQNSLYVISLDWLPVEVTGLACGDEVDEFIFVRNSEKRCLSSKGAAGCGCGVSGVLGNDLFPRNLIRGVRVPAEQQRREGCMVVNREASPVQRLAASPETNNAPILRLLDCYSFQGQSAPMIMNCVELRLR